MDGKSPAEFGVKIFLQFVDASAIMKLKFS